MKEIIVIRTSDPDGSIFRSLLGALQGTDVQILHALDQESSTLTLGAIEIFPEQRRVMKAGAEICLNYGEFSILYCMARCPCLLYTSCFRVRGVCCKGGNTEKDSHNTQ